MHLNAIIKSIAGGASSAHAYIVEGNAGSRRDDFIKRLAMGLECRCADLQSRPCGCCDACRQVAAGSSMDVVRMQMSGKNGYKTEDANAFSSRLDMGAYGRYLIGIIDDADSLSETVQNKLLKTLEEPRPGVILLLGTSNPDHLLSTVRSRCSIIRLQAVQEASDETEGEKAEALKTAATLLGGEGAFCEFRDAMEKHVKTRGDALALIDYTEEGFRERMLAGDSPAAMADRLELCEKARADIERDMDRSKALKRLRLELTGH
ncbi:MAG: hypothetical protein IKF42_12455 [Mogibacterium sp.]|nr:hypothetical protein [Mogibacterium sp.]